MRSAFARDFTGYFAATPPDRACFVDGSVPFAAGLLMRAISFLQPLYTDMLSAFGPPNKKMWNGIPDHSAYELVAMQYPSQFQKMSNF